jgi:hypothetical protein
MENFDISVQRFDEFAAEYAVRFMNNFNYHSRTDLENSFAENGFEIRHLKLQEYPEPDGHITTDMIFIGTKI